MTPIQKASMMIDRWNGDKVMCLAIANENLTLKKDIKDKVGINFWNKVIEALGK